jgi:oligosaccharide repeat unit polymerase
MFDLNIAFEYMQFSPSDYNLAITHFVVSFGLLAFLYGYIKSSEMTNQSNIILTILTMEINWKPLILTWITLFPIVLYSVYVGISTLFSFDAAVQMDKINGVSINASHIGYLVDAQFFLIALCLLLIYKLDFKWFSFVPLIAYMVFRALTGWARWTILLTLLNVGFLLLHRHKKKWPPVSVLYYFIPIILLFYFLGRDRSILFNLAMGYGPSEVVELKDFSVYQFLDGLDFANFDYLSYIIAHVPSASGTFTWGTQYLQIFTEPIPRLWWPDKPAGPPISLFDLNSFGNFVGLTTSTLGDGWMTLGFPGAMIVQYLFGKIYGKVYKWFEINKNSKLASIIYLTIASLFIQFFRDGGILSILEFIFFTTFPFLLYIVFGFIINTIEHKMKT